MPSVATQYEIRWRLASSSGPWSTKIVPVTTEAITLDGLERGKSYEGEARALSAAGTPSDWTPVTFTVADPSMVPRAPTGLSALAVADGVSLKWTADAEQPADVEYCIERAASSGGTYTEFTRVRAMQYTYPLTDATVWWFRVRAVNFGLVYSAYSGLVSSAGVQVSAIAGSAAAAAAAAAAAQADANAANANLANIASDSLLTPDEKPRVIQDRDVIVAEQAGIDAQATAYAITTEKTTYDTAVAALTTYLATLTAPVLWSNLGGNTTIVGATFRSKFADVYAARQTLLNRIVERARSLSDSGEGVTNGNFEEGLQADGTPIGWVKIGATISTNFNYGGAFGNRSLRIQNTIQYGGAYSEKRYQCDPGDRFLVGGYIWNIAGAGAELVLTFIDGAGAAISSDGPIVYALDGYFVFRSKEVVVPSGTVCFIIQCLHAEVAFGGDAIFDNISISRIRNLDSEVEHGTTYGRTANTDLYDSGGVRRIGLRIGGSGQRIGRQDNLLQVVSQNVATTTKLSANSSGQVTVIAHVANYGSFAVSYSGVTNAVTGLTVGSTYVIYCVDDAFAGGTRTWFAGTNPATVAAIGDGVYIAGQITIPAAGSSSGGAGGGGTSPGDWCVAADSFLPDGTHADAIRPGMMLPCYNEQPHAPNIRHLTVEKNDSADAECLRLCTMSGASVVASLTTPMTLIDGRCVPITDMLHRHALVYRLDGTFAWEEVIALQPMGIQRVSKIVVHQQCYFAGETMDAFIATHNPLNQKP
jgi:hypothetical protein